MKKVAGSKHAVKNGATGKRDVTEGTTGKRDVTQGTTGKRQVKNGATGRRKITTAPVKAQAWQPELRTRFVADVAGGTRRAADLLDVAPSQPSRWMTGESVPGPAQARMLVDIDHVLAHALLLWADASVARDWLTTPNAHLDGIRPVEWIRMHGTAEVVEALRAEAAGAYG
jgi:hypothetical protein